MHDALGTRMKVNYESPWQLRLPARMPTILRLDGRSFHQFTRDMDRPFDYSFVRTMRNLATYLCAEIATTQFAYVQSDEISLLLHNYRRFDTQGWFGNEVQKMVSISAGLASSWFSRTYEREAVFDARIFVLPEAEVANYFIWRQQDAVRNSVTMLAQAHFSHGALNGKSRTERMDMLMEKEINWNDLPTAYRRGSSVFRCEEGWKVDTEIPIFTQDRAYIERHLAVEEGA